MAEDKYIQSLVYLVCDKGSLVVTFIATPKKETHHGMTGGTTRDNIPLLNILPFAVCVIDRIPCIPLMPEWKRYPKEPVVIENFHPLLLSSYCKCQKGGNIKVFETYAEAADYLASESASRVNGYGWLDETICGILAPGMVIGNRLFGKAANSQAVGRGFRQGLLNSWEGIKSLGKAETWKGLGNMAAIAIIGYSGPIPPLPGVPEARLAAFDAVFKTNLANTDMAMKMALVEAVDQKLINGTEVEHNEFIGAAYAAVLEAAVGTKGGALAVKGVTSGGKMALGLQRSAALANRFNKFQSSIKWSKFKDVFGLFRKKPSFNKLSDAQSLLKETLANINKLSPKEIKEITTVVAGYNRKTGKVGVAIKNSKTMGKNLECAEDLLVKQLGGNAEDIVFTEAMRPRTGKNVPVCKRCQTKYNRSQFEDGTLFEE